MRSPRKKGEQRLNDRRFWALETGTWSIGVEVWAGKRVGGRGRRV